MVNEWKLIRKMIHAHTEDHIPELENKYAGTSFQRSRRKGSRRKGSRKKKRRGSR
jgi:hypothetical protein